MANTASAMAINTMALRALVRNAILTDMAPTWANAVAKDGVWRLNGNFLLD